MGRIINIGLAAAVLSSSAFLILAGTKGIENKEPIAIASAYKSVTLTNEQLRSVPLVHHVFNGDKVDRTFRIPLGNEAYIDGAILFNDCSYQRVGSTLGDAFGIHNTDSEPNAYNFNIFFSFEHISEMRVNATVTSYVVDENSYERSQMMAKYAAINTDLYSALSSTSYSQLVGPAGSSSFYMNGAPDYNYTNCTLNAASKEQGVSCQPHSSPLNLAAFQFTHDNNFIDNGNEITCTIQSLYFEYYCG